MQTVCQRCGDYADLEDVGDLPLCATCLARGDDPRATGMRIRTVFAETLQLSFRLRRVALWLVALTAAQSVVEFVVMMAAQDARFAFVFSEWARLPLEVLTTGIVISATSDYLQLGKLPRLSQACASAVAVWPTLLEVTLFCRAPALITSFLATVGGASGASVPASVVTVILNIAILFYAAPIAVVDRAPFHRALILAPSLLRRSFKPFVVCAFLFGALPSVFHISDTTVLSTLLKSSWRVTPFVAVANALLAPFALPHLVLRTLLFAKLRPSVAQFR